MGASQPDCPQGRILLIDDDPALGGFLRRVLCSRGGYCGSIASPASLGADVLFVIDNSSSMGQEQAALRAQFFRN